MKSLSKMILVILFTILLLICMNKPISSDSEIDQTVTESPFPSTRNVTGGANFSIACEPSKVNLTLTSGSIEEIHLTVRNLGNGSDHIRLGSPDDAELEKAGIYYEGYEELTLIPENKSVVIPVQISAGKNVDTREIDFELRVISDSALAEGDTSVYSTVDVHLVIEITEEEKDTTDNYIEENWLTFDIIGVIFLLVFVYLIIRFKRGRERKSS